MMKEDYDWMHNPPEEKKFNPLTHMSAWPRQNFSLQYMYQYNIKKTNDDDKEEYQLGDY